MNPDADGIDGPSAGQPDGEPDSGLAGERTHLAWTRTAISFAAVGAAVLRASPVAGVFALTASGLIWGVGRLASRSVLNQSGDRHRLIALITASSVALSVGAVVLAVLGGHHASPLPGPHKLLP